jgi:adenylate kinase
MQLVLLGPPGVGKGTQAERISRRFGLAHISTGDILRDEVRRRTVLGKKARTHLEHGTLVPDDLTLGVVEKAIRRRGRAHHGCLYDGFPRNIAQAQGLDAILEDLRAPLDRVLYLKAPSRVLIRRLTKRLVCKRCRKVHASVADAGSPRVCGACGGELQTRTDDAPETVRNRLRVYREETAPLIRFYARRGCFSVINAAGGIEEVWKTIRDILVEGGARILRCSGR